MSISRSMNAAGIDPLPSSASLLRPSPPPSIRLFRLSDRLVLQES